MATTSRVQVTEGSGKNIASYSITEDAVTKDIQRIVINDSNGVEIAKAVDSVAGSTDPGFAPLAIRDDVLTVLTPADGDYVNIRVGQWGDQWVSLATKLDSTNDSVTADTELPAAATIAADGVTPTVPGLAGYNFIKTPGANTWDRQYSVVNATNSTGIGILAAGLIAQLDNTSPTVPTENQFANVRMHKIRSLMASPWSGTGTQTSVGDSASSVTLLAANLDRIGATIFNDSSAILYIKFGATASNTSFATQLAANDYFEVPFGYTGIIDGIWASDAGGNARVTEIT